MLDLTQILLVVVIVILTVLLSVIGVQVILILKEARATLHRANHLVDQLEDLIDKLAHPAQSLGNLMTGVKQGVQIVETITSLFKNRVKPSPYEDELP